MDSKPARTRLSNFYHKIAHVICKQTVIIPKTELPPNPYPTLRSLFIKVDAYCIFPILAPVGKMVISYGVAH